MSDEELTDAQQGQANEKANDAPGGDDAAARAKAEAIAKAKALAQAKAAAKAKAPAAKAQAPAKAAGKGEAEPEKPVIPDRYQPMLEALGKEFPGIEFAPEFNPGDGYLYLKVPGEQVIAVGTFLRDRFNLNYLRNLSGVDWLDRLQVVYHLLPLEPDGNHDLLVGLLVDVDREKPVTPSVVSVWPTANWFEREALDLFGIQFEGHPNPTRILLPENWQGGYPLRKDFVDKRPKKQRKVRPR